MENKKKTPVGLIIALLIFCVLLGGLGAGVLHVLRAPSGTQNEVIVSDSDTENADHTPSIAEAVVESEESSVQSAESGNAPAADFGKDGKDAAAASEASAQKSGAGADVSGPEAAPSAAASSSAPAAAEAVPAAGEVRMGDAQGELEDGTPVALVGVDLNAPTIRSMTDPAFFQGCPERIVKLLTPNPYSRSQDRLESVNDIVIHYVGNAGSSAMENRDYFESLQDGSTSASSHFIVGLEGEIVQCVPLSEIAYATKNRNVDTISIEICHPDADGKFSDVTYRSAIRLTAWLCKAFGIGPEHVIRHYDVTGKLCPLYYVEHPDAWEQFLSDVRTEYEQNAST